MRSKLFLLIILILAVAIEMPGQKSGRKITVSGVVFDINNHPVPEAVIMVDGKNTGIRTDSEGYYKIKVKPSSVNISVYSFASGILEEPINGRTQINFFLGRSAGQPPVNTGNSYGEEIINIGYGSVKRKDMTDQINKINASDKTNASYSNIYEMIKGKVPNVEVSGKSIRIQGSSSFIGESTEPLLVVDGTIVDTIEDISPQSVRSIEILKGPSAAIYGSRGANGVIMISLISAGDR